MDINTLRKTRPELAGLDDGQVVDVIHQTYYPDLDKGEIASKLGVKLATPEAAVKARERTLAGTAGDVGISLLKGAIAVPEAAVGLADLATDGRVGKALEGVGFRPAEARKILDTGYSDAQQDANAAVQGAEGFVDTLGAAVRNPSVIAHAALESAPSMLGGGVVGRGVTALAPRVGPAVAAALGEGVVGAGSAAEQIRQQTGDGLLSADQAMSAGASGAGTALFGALGGKVAQKLGIGDVDTMIVAASRDAGVRKGVVRSMLEGAASEGLLEELPQSIQEQMWQNHALGKPLDEGVDQAAVLGMLTGGAMGGGAAVFARPGDAIRAAKVPETGPLSRASNLALEAQAQQADAGQMPMGVPAQEQAGADATPADPLLQRREALNAQLLDEGVREAIRTKIGDDALNEALYYANAARGEGLPGKTADRLMALAERIVSDSQLEPITPIAEPPGLPMADNPGAPALEGPEALLQIGIDTQPTGVIRVDGAGNAAPEVRADALSTRQAVEDAESLGKPVPRGAPAVPAPAPVMTAPAAEAQMQEVAQQQPLELEQEGQVAASAATPAPVAEPTAAPSRKGSFASAEEAQAYISQQRRAASASLPKALPIEHEDGSFGVSTDGQPEFSTAQQQTQARERAAAGIQDGDILTAKGLPFAAKGLAMARAKKVGGEVVPVKGGFVVRPVQEKSGGEHSEPTPVAGEDGAGGRDVSGPGLGDLRPNADDQPGRGTGAADAPVEAGGSSMVDGVGPAGQADAVTQAANEAATSPANDRAEPTEAQREAGNFKMGHTKVGGLDVTVEYPKGSERVGKGKDGTEWRRPMNAHYGYIKRTTGADGENVDVYVGPAPDAEKVFIVDQVHADGSFDEHKVMMGFKTELAARRSYLSHYPKGWKIGGMKAMTVGEFKDWLKGDTSAPAAAAAPAAEPAAAPTASPSAAKPASAKIDDFGEVLHGARKHYAEAYRDSMKDATSVDLKAEPLSKSWPEPNYAKLLEDGADPAAVAFVHAARDEVPTKPKMPGKLQRWAAQAQQLRQFSFDLLNGKITVDAVRSKLAEPEFSRLREAVGGRADLYEAVGHDRSLKGVELSRGEYGLFEGKIYSPRKVIWTVERPAVASAFSHWPVTLASGDTRQAAINAFIAKVKGSDQDNNPVARAALKTSFDIYSKRGKPGFFIGKKVGKAHIDLKTFPTVQEAREFKANNQEELERLLAKYKEIPFERRDTNQPRVGQDHRQGARMTPEAFSEAFGFRGVQFGNYVEDGRRQQDLDDAYDALMDLAAVLDIPPRVLSLNGELGLAFGARGKGGKRAAMAHYEPGTVVINLTKNSGAGSLAHEWFHALDNYFARSSGDKRGYATLFPHYASMRAQMQDAFKGVMSAIKASGVPTRSAVLDERRTKAYWATDIEMAARSFESYVIAKLQDQGAANDYLANVVGEQAFRDGEYPYPNAADLPQIRAAFDHFFSTIEHRPTEGGRVALFSRAPSFDATVGAVLTGQLPESTQVAVTDTSGVYAALGMRDLPIGTTGDRIAKMHFDHGLTRSDLRALPELLESPLMVFESDTQKGTLVAVLDLWKNGVPVVAAIHPDRKAGRADINLLASAYPKDRALQIKKWADDGLLRYLDKEKTRGAATSGGVQFPWLVQLTRGSGAKVLGPSDIVKGPLASRGPGGGVDVKELRAMVAPIAKRWKAGPAGGVSVVATVDDLPAHARAGLTSQDVDGVARAWYFPETQTVYLIADRLASMEDAQFALFHEVYGHHGLRSVLGDGYAQAMTALRRANPHLAAEASMWFAQYGATEIAARVSAGMSRVAAEREVRLVSTEEALADRAGAGQPLKGWKLVAAKLQAFLRKLGLHDVADWMETHTEAETLDLLAQARRAVQKGPMGVVFEPGFVAATASRSGAPLASRPSLATALRDSMNSAKDVALPAGYRVGDFLTSAGKLSWWHKTVGTQYNLAQRSPLFKKVFDATQSFLNDVSFYATEAADLAPSILPKLETWRDLGKSPLSAEDTKAIAAPIFEGTLHWMRDDKGSVVEANDVSTAGVVWSTDELRARFGLSDRQIQLYREFREATDRSLTRLAISDMLRYAGADAKAITGDVMAMDTVAEAAEGIKAHLQAVAAVAPGRAEELTNTASTIEEKADRARDLMGRGYAPLSRFGQYTVYVTQGDDQLYFGMFESKAEASRMARRMRQDHPDANIEQGTVSQEAFKLFAGVSPETLELFGGMLGLEPDGDSAASQAFQTYLKLAKANRSAMKRLIARKGVAGFSEDAGRVLAGFVYSNARQTAGNLHMGDMTSAAHEIPKGEGELKDAAVRLTEYVKNPQEEAQRLRGLLFAQYLGGSIASAMVNATQPIAVTFPYLSQWGGVQKAGDRMTAALADAMKKSTGDQALDAALKHAEETGIVSPQEVHQLMAQAGGKASLKAGDGTLAGNALAVASNSLSKFSLAWGKVFGLAEQFNRRTTFIAAYRTAVEEGLDDPAAFAAQAIAETQFVYNKGNKPRWARGAVGSVAFTFKQYSVSYVELISRMAKQGPEGRKAALLALGVLFLLSGADGVPFAEDVEDVIDGVMQRLGYNFSTQQAKQEFFARTFGEAGGRFVEKGISGLPGVPIDVSGRMGMGNLIPSTGLFLKKQDYSRDVAELAGPAADLVKRAGTAASQAINGDLGQAAVTISPVAARNLAKAYDMATMGMYRDDKGRKVLDADGYEALAKAIGFQPNAVARIQEATAQQQQMIALNKIRTSEISDLWAQGLFERDQEKVARARELRDVWNRDNPDSPIKVNIVNINKRVRAMRQDKATRIENAAPKAVRAAVREQLQEAGS